MGHIEFDTSELDRFAADLSRAPGRIQRKAPKVFEVAANKIKKTLRADASGHDYLPHLARTVNYDRLGPLAYEIGFDDVGQGELAGIAVYGSVNNAGVVSPPSVHARRELPDMLRHLGDAGEDSVLGGDGER